MLHSLAALASCGPWRLLRQTSNPWLRRDLFEKFIRENDGYFPIKVQGLPEGTVANSHVPVYQITAEGDYARLVTFFETILTQVIGCGNEFPLASVKCPVGRLFHETATLHGPAGLVSVHCGDPEQADAF